ncbi:MAG: T9SS type A sorting domain-containing protein [Flavobacteriales bacterium]|nr:T9SS type A sorting domain-containing protein [Flavobacteriales bacterium]MCX7767942.1 T9SS type A sorting domain-containing protein [Flavobacteriales bacterium]MDW8409346.1 T9SS type A sorting domain-containing protein [Flavobacteriales bacterium]
MRKRFTVVFSLLGLGFVSAQNYVSDRVYMGSGYAHEVFYSLSQDSVGASLIKNWDLAFSVYGGNSNEFLSILANHINGVTIYHNNIQANQNNFDNLDTTGLHTWQKLYNTDTSWWYGAFNLEPYAHPQYSWATYTTNGTMTGRYIYVVELATSGQPPQYKKLWIKKKSSISGSVSLEFVYADLDGNNMHYLVYDNLQDQYPSKRYMFYSLRNNQPLDREPVRTAWDITFTRYLAPVSVGGSTTMYPVTGVLANQGVQVARVSGVLPADAQPGMAPYSSAMNGIGYDWKYFNNSTFQWIIVDTLSYFLKDLNGSVWHLYFTDFGGQSNGMCAFEKKLVSTAALNSSKDLQNFLVYPNPAGSITYIVVTSQKESVGSVGLQDLWGRLICTKTIALKEGFSAIPVPLEDIPNGVYTLTLSTTEGVMSTRLVVNHGP